MNPIQYLIDLIHDPRAAIAGWIATLGAAWVYAPLFLIVFIETGVVVMPFLPGDSLLFAAGVFANDGGGLSLLPLLVTVWCAAVLGDQCNFAIGHFFGRRIIASGKVKSMTPERIAKSQAFLDKWGPLAVFLGRFFPFIRTFVPFLSGMGGMHWRHFVIWNVLGGITWSSLFVLLGYFFGGVPFVQDHFELVLVLIIAISVVPAAVGAVKGWLSRRRKAKDGVRQEQGMGGAASAPGVQHVAKRASSAAPAAAGAAPQARRGDAEGEGDADDAGSGSGASGAATASAPAVGRHFASSVGAATAAPAAAPSTSATAAGSTEAWLIAAGMGLTTAGSDGDGTPADSTAAADSFGGEPASAVDTVFGGLGDLSGGCADVSPDVSSPDA